ncbi:MAG TPA: insulinase family protein [Polyangiaceae bacterium]|jgi:predicted Zn-dependent peptidase|nr:insulinase family protein [Polyangiaceae bacterium]
MTSSSLRSLSQRCGGAALSALALTFLAQPASAWSSSCESAERYTLRNGVEVVLVPETGLPTVAVVSSVHTGFRDDPPGHEGLAHYVEHLTFAGDSNIAPIMDLYEEIGATGLNATTSADTTDYYALVPASQLERAIWIEARRLALGVDVPSDERALAERRVLLREHASRYGYVPAYSLMRATYAEIYPAGHPYHSPFASAASIGQLTLNDARWFFAQHYRPDQTRLILVGDFASESAKALIDQYFGEIAGRAAPSTAAADDDAGSCRGRPPRSYVARNRIVQHTRSRNERLELIWPVVAGENTEQLRGAFNTLSGELSQALRQTGLSHSVNAELVEHELGSFWDLRIEVAPGQPFDKVEPLVARVLQSTQAQVENEQGLLAKRQAFELSDRLAREGLLERALGLARRTCSEQSCVDPSKPGALAGAQQAGRFSLGVALVVERRYSIGASAEGDLEVVR